MLEETADLGQAKPMVCNFQPILAAIPAATVCHGMSKHAPNGLVSRGGVAASGALLHGVDVRLLQLVKSREIHHSCPSLHSYCAPEHGAGNGGRGQLKGGYQLYKLYLY